MPRARWFLFAAVALAGCASAPRTNYYTLDMRPSAHREQPAPIEIWRLRISEPLAGRNILVQASPTRIEYYAVDQWAAGIEELVREKLEAEFQFSGGRTAGPAGLVVDGIIQNFGQEDTPDGAVAYLKAAIEFRTPEMGHYQEPLLRKTYEIRKPAQAADAPSVVQALSRCVETLADEMLADAQALRDRK